MKKNHETFQQKKDVEQHFSPENRLGVERRQFSYSFYIPERRSGKDRRSELNIEITIE